MAGRRKQTQRSGATSTSTSGWIPSVRLVTTTRAVALYAASPCLHGTSDIDIGEESRYGGFWAQVHCGLFGSNGNNPKHRPHGDEQQGAGEVWPAPTSSARRHASEV